MNGILQGPLPQTCNQHELEENSMRAIMNMFPTNRFVIREITGRDAGTDRLIEAKAEMAYTNCCAFAQIKSTEKFAPNSDGSISVEIAVSNIVYMRNGTCPIYILWVAETNELRYVWVKDILNSYDYGWQKQQTLTIRFEKKINSQALDEIHQRIIRESILARDIRENISRFAQPSPLFAIDQETLKIGTPDEAKSVLLKTGMEIVLCGNPCGVEMLYNRLQDGDKADPNLLLPLAYASLEKGDYDSSKNIIRRITLQKGELTRTNYLHYQWINNYCDFVLKRKNIDDYVKDLDLINITTSGTDNLIYRLEMEFTKYLQCHLNLWKNESETENDTKKAEARKNIDDLCEEIDRSSTTDQSIAHTAIIVKNLVDGLEISQRIARCQLRITVLLSNREFPKREYNDLAAFVEAYNNWYKEMLSKIMHYEQISNRHFYFYVVTQASTIVVSTLSILVIGQHVDCRVNPIYDAMLTDTIYRTESAIKYYEATHMTGRLIRARLTQMNLYELAGKFEESRTIAKDNIAIASILFDDEKLLNEYKDHLAGNSVLGLCQKRQSGDILSTIPSDEKELKQFLQILRHNGAEIDEDHLFYFDKCYRTIQLHCKYLQPLESLITPAQYKLICTLNGEEGTASHDLEVIFDEFKKERCLDCSSRSSLNDEQ